MSCPIGVIRYLGATPTSTTGDTTLYDGLTAGPARMLQLAGVGRVSVALGGVTSGSGTLSMYSVKAGQKAADYRLVKSQAITFGTEDQVYDFLTANHDVVKFVFTNDGTAKPNFEASLALVEGTDPSQ